MSGKNMCHEKTKGVMKECVIKNKRVMKNSCMLSWKKQNVPMRIAIEMYVNNVMNDAMNKVRGGHHTKNIHGIIHDIIHVHTYSCSHT